MAARLLAYGRLLRLSLAPSALADIAAGVVLGAGSWPAGGAPLVLMLASACVYHGGMALNDWADRAADARTRPDRPIPRGAIRAPVALALALGLLVVGPLLAFSAQPRAGSLLAGVAVLAALYDLAGRGAWLGPALLASCRAGNLGSGLLLGLGSSPDERSLLWAVVPLYGLYVFAVSRLARLEDAPEAELARPRAMLGIGLLLVAIALPAPFAALATRAQADSTLLYLCAGAALALTLCGAAGLIRQGLRASWSRADVLMAVGMSLRRLLVASAAIAVQAGTRDGLVVAASILLGYPLSYLLRRVFPPT